jgi:hypothetical protein
MVGILCGAIQDWVAFTVVFGLTILNAMVTIYEEMQSEKAIDALRVSMGTETNVKVNDWFLFGFVCLVFLASYCYFIYFFLFFSFFLFNLPSAAFGSVEFGSIRDAGTG